MLLNFASRFLFFLLPAELFVFSPSESNKHVSIPHVYLCTNKSVQCSKRFLAGNHYSHTRQTESYYVTNKTTPTYRVIRHLSTSKVYASRMLLFLLFSLLYNIFLTRIRVSFIYTCGTWSCVTCGRRLQTID